MSCDRVRGTWARARFIFDGVANAVEDDSILEVTSVTNGVVSGRFLDPNTGDPLTDSLTGGTCTPEGQRSRLTLTRNHAGGRVTTVYTGIVILVTGTTTVMIRQGRFTRTTTDVNLMLIPVMGDWETEKPT
jgi:hypothetical protein